MKVRAIAAAALTAALAACSAAVSASPVTETLVADRSSCSDTRP